MRKILVIIPAYNEQETLPAVIKDVKGYVKGADVLVVNDCSTDETADILSGHKVKYINNIFNLGYALSVQTGIKYAARNNYDYVIQMDADGQHLASEAKKLLEVCEHQKADIVLGSRYLSGGGGYKVPLFRRLGAMLFSVLIRVFCHKKIADPLTGFQCLSKGAINKYAKIGNYPEYPDASLVIDMIMQGYKVVEVPAKMKQREKGTSMHHGIIKPIVYMVTQIGICILVFIKNIGRKR